MRIALAPQLRSDHSRGEILADNSELRGPVGIDPGFSSIVAVERFRVLELE